MLIIAGLGNPTLKYRHTRHNAGFDAIDELSKIYGIPVKKTNFKGKFGEGNINGEKVVLVKPQTFMNNSGECLKPLLDYYNADPEKDLVVISDDVMLAPGRVRIRKKGSAGGHNGLKSIINCVGTDKFIRLRVGVGIFEEGDDMIRYVLGRLSKDDRKNLEKTLSSLPEVFDYLIKRDVDGAMNAFNNHVF
ncbi:MAG: aminoacyl-tRNA hydrolase [Lachnospiraceae bacterium]|nr:aminoacyl-tRNA hydrolase [Lachnospiraceae bacterium]